MTEQESTLINKTNKGNGWHRLIPANVSNCVKVVGNA